MSLPRIALTVGDPAGIGPEIVEKALSHPRVRAVCEPVVYGPRDLSAFRSGELSPEAGRAAYDAIVEAVRDALSGKVAAVATAPVSKEAFALAGLPWRGHTDLLAHLTGSRDYAMMFYSQPLRVVLATVHVPLSEVPGLITESSMARLFRLAAAELPRFGFPTPRLAVAALDPHAGEHGVIGREDDQAIRPAVAAARAEGIDVEGPFPADTLFVQAARGRYDAVIACYHDQGLIPVKLLAFGRSVNVTLGLPIIRTSVDHGTAFDIAGQGIAEAGSMVEAIVLAASVSSGSSSSPSPSSSQGGGR
jgi:4-hydroxythreonine-4-phosphate dehydrogenase